MDSEKRTRRSDTTRAAILEAARHRFATDGYDRATIRAIAADAQIDPSMVIRYYGSKEELFASAVEVSFQVPDSSGLTPEEAGAALVRRMFELWEGGRIVLARLRRAVNDPDTAAQVRQTIEEEGVAFARPFCADEDEARRRAALIATQIMGISLCRYILEVPEIAAMDLDELVAWYGPTIQRYLTEPLPAR
jgi:AcrR family transcriptional regulator